MPLKNKYGTLRVGVERGYYEHRNSKDSMDVDFIATKLFNEKEMIHKIKDMTTFLKTNKTHSYKVKPLFGHQMEDTNIWENNIYGIISEWIDPDNENSKFAEYSTDALQKELEWANYIFVSNLILNRPRLKCDNYARTINAYLKENNSMSITLKVPTFTYLSQMENKGNGQLETEKKEKEVEIIQRNETNEESVSSKEVQTEDTCKVPMLMKREEGSKKQNVENTNDKLVTGWELWKRFSSYINFNYTNINAAIELVSSTKSELKSINLDVWKSEPVKLIVIPLNAFIMDLQGYPYLPKKYKDLLIFFFRKNIEILLLDTVSNDSSAKNGCSNSENEYIQVNGEKRKNYYLPNKENNKTFLNYCIYYIKRLFSSIENFDNEKLFDYYYWDYLQIPLQPLKDNLQSQTYEDFEKDKTKYEMYELAINKYLADELKKNPNKKFVIFVVGAGRGALVDSAMLALEKNKVTNFHIYAIEKNKSAVMVLQNRHKTDTWKKYVTVILKDMRYLQNIEKADLIISELLGSFGDNELFPECLDGVQKYLKIGGKSIPQNCLSYIEPICCSELYFKILQNKFDGNNQMFYVINIYSFCPVSIDGAKECFYFETPNKDLYEYYHQNAIESDSSPQKNASFGSVGEKNGIYVKTHNTTSVLDTIEMPIEQYKDAENDNLHNKRYREISFKVKTDSMLHGFLCYFKSQLYADVYLSIEPTSQTPRLRSWYPLFMPLNKMVSLKKNDTVSLSIWRLTDTHRVWYEWCLNEPFVTNIHNANGKYFFIGK